MRSKIVTLCIIVLLLLACIAGGSKITRLQKEVEKYRENTIVLLDTVATYRTRDSLNAAQVGALTLTLNEYKQYRKEDLALIKSLKAKNRELQAVNSTQFQAIIELQARPKDTILLVDSIPAPAKIVYCGDEWYDFKGVMTQESFSGELQNRDAILITETVKYKRFLGFLWKTGIKNRKIDVVSRNPHTTIISTEHVIIKK